MHVEIKSVCTLRGGFVYVAHVFQRVKVLFQRHLRKQRLRVELEPAGVTRRAGVSACRKVRVGGWVRGFDYWGGGGVVKHPPSWRLSSRAYLRADVFHAAHFGITCH